MRVSEYAKAITAGLVVFGVRYAAARGLKTEGAEGVTSGEWIDTLVATAIAGLSVWLVPNATALVVRHRPDSDKKETLPY